MNMTEKELRGDIRSPKGMYFFYGDEDYMKNHFAAEIQKAVTGDEDATVASFNRVCFYDDTYTLEAVRDAVYAPPVMTQKKLVDISFADMDRTLDEKSKTALIEMLAEAFSGGSGEDTDISETVVLVLRVSAEGFEAGTPKRPSGFLKKAESCMKAVRIDYRTDALLTRWLERHAAEYGLTISGTAAIDMMNLCGRGMYRLSGELAKAAAYTAESGKSEITSEEVARAVTRTDEDDAFRLANCILEGNVTAALDALAIKKRRKEEPIYILGQITRVFCDLVMAAHAHEDGLSCAEFAKKAKMHTYRAGIYWNAARTRRIEEFDRAVIRCADADRKLKSTPLGYAVIERLICGSASADRQSRR